MDEAWRAPLKPLKPGHVLNETFMVLDYDRMHPDGVLTLTNQTQMLLIEAPTFSNEVRSKPGPGRLRADASGQTPVPDASGRTLDV